MRATNKQAKQSNARSADKRMFFCEALFKYNARAHLKLWKNLVAYWWCGQREDVIYLW